MNNGQNMLHKLSLDANSMASVGIYEMFSFGKQILPDSDTRDIWLSNSMCVQQGFPSKPLAYS